MPSIKDRLRRLPTPRYLRKINRVAAMAANTPLLVCQNISENVNIFAKKKILRKLSSANFLSGSTKRIIKTKTNHSKIVEMRAGKKFFLFLISRSRILRRLLSFGDTIDIWILC